MSEGGRGKQGGLSEYARLIGKTHGYITQIVQAGKVVTQVTGLATSQLLEKAKHLAAIHKAPEGDWEWLVKEMVEGEYPQCKPVKSLDI